MSKYRIFISIHYLEIGGAEISLIGLLNAIDYSRYDVDLFLQSHQGELMKLIPSGVNFLPEILEYSLVEKPLKKALFSKYWKVGIARLWGKSQTGFASIFHPVAKGLDDNRPYQFMSKIVSKVLPTISLKEYDLAVNFCGMPEIILDKVKAKKKITWLHTDYSKVVMAKKSAFKTWNAFDHIISISPDVTKAFLSIFPSFESKIIEIENIVSKKYVEERSKEFSVSSEMNGGEIKLLSIGRYCYQKKF